MLLPCGRCGSTFAKAVAMFEPHTVAPASIEECCQLVVEQTRKIAEHYERIEEISCNRRLPLQAIFVAIGRDMIAREQKTMRVGPYTIEVGMNYDTYCECHRALVSECPTEGSVVHVRLATGEPYVKVHHEYSVRRKEVAP